MGNSEVAIPTKTEKVASSVLEQTSVHPYPDWAAMQAYYGAGVAMPSPYFSTTVTPGHAPHPYMWTPQLVMPPFGTPYSAIYPHGGVYSHLSEGGHGAVTSPTAREAAMVMQETTAKSPNDKDSSTLKKLKGPDGIAASVCNGKEKKEDRNVADAPSQSVQSEVKSSSKRSEKSNMEADNQTQSKIAREDTAAGKAMGSDIMTKMEVRVSTAAKPKIAAQVSPTNSTLAPNCDVVPPGQWIQDDRELKREKRKQSNRESARRSRLRKQVETEELAQKVESLSAENLVLKSEISQLSEDSAKLRLENSSLMDKLKNVKAMQKEDFSYDETEAKISPSVGTENFLSKIANSTSFGRRSQQNKEIESSGKLHQLLEPGPRADAAVAS